MGTGTFAQVLDFHLRADSDYDVVGFTADQTQDMESSFLGRPLVPFDTVADVFPPTDHAMFVAVGYRKRSSIRARLCEAARQKGYELITYVSSTAHHHDDLVTGMNCCILGEATLEPFVTLGHDVIVWGGAHISHHTTVGDHCFLGPQAAIASETRIGKHCFIGINATIRDGITVADDCFIGAGAIILRDTQPGEVYVGGAHHDVPSVAATPALSAHPDL